MKNLMDLWCLAFLAAHGLVVAWHWHIGPSLALVAVSCLMTYSVGCIQHCHGHTPIFRRRAANRSLDFLFTLLRGDGCLAWKATHNANHHRFANRPGDYTLTYRFSRENNLPQFLLYLAHGTWTYVRASAAYLGSLLARGSTLGFLWVAQLAAYGLLFAALWFRNPEATLYAVLIPQAFGILAMVGTGYFQHHHADERHPFDGSRNFTGRLLNLLNFNHGYHLAHHRNINMHWTEWPREHARIRSRIHPALEEKSLPWYLLRIFILQHFHSPLRTVDLRARTVKT